MTTRKDLRLLEEDDEARFVNSPEPPPEPKAEHESREQAAREVGISGQTLTRYEKIQEEADEKTKEHRS